jgi:L-serine deaminase
MRTTVTLDPDVAAKLRARARERGVSFKEVLNASVRRGLQDSGVTPQPYRVRAQALRAKPGVSLDRALALAGELEDSETLHKLSLRK